MSRPAHPNGILLIRLLKHDTCASVTHLLRERARSEICCGSFSAPNDHTHRLVQFLLVHANIRRRQSTTRKLTAKRATGVLLEQLGQLLAHAVSHCSFDWLRCSAKAAGVWPLIHR